MNRPSLEVAGRQPVAAPSLAVTFRLRTLGTMRLDAAEGASSPLLGPSKPLALIVYLALSPGHSASRRHIADLLWGGGNVSDPARALRQALSLIKRDTSPLLIQSDADLVILRHDLLHCDAWEFVQALELRDLATAVARYEGNFIEDFATPGASAFEEWCDAERARLQTHFLQAAETLIRAQLDAGHARQAVSAAKALRRRVPHAVRGWAMLIEALLAAGDTLAARAESSLLDEYLRREELEPEPGIAALLRVAQKGALPTADDAPDFQPELVGREREFATLMQGWHDATRDRLSVIYVEGQAGMGKSRLARDFIARLRAGRARTAFVRAHPGERRLPFSVASSLAASLAKLPGGAAVSPGCQSVLVALNPSLSAAYTATAAGLTNDETFRLRAGLALVEIVEAIVDRGPLVIAIDDLHWCDDASREVLSMLFARLDKQAVLVLMTGRPGGAVPALPSGALQLVLGALDERQVAAVIASIAILPESPWAADVTGLIHRAARGVPFYVIEALRLCVDEGLLTIAGGGWRCEVPSGLERILQPNTLVAARLHGLDDSGSMVLERAAIAGAPLPPQLLFDGTDAAADQSLALMLERDGLLARRGDDWEVAHDEIAATLLTEIEPARSRGVHRWLGDRMKRSLDATWREQAVRHFTVAEDWREAGALARVLLRGTRNTEEDGRRLQDLTGEPAGSQSLAQVRAALPWHFRHRRSLRRLSIAGVAVLGPAAGAAYAVTRPDPPPPDAILSIWTPNATGGMRPDVAEVRADAWVPEQAIQFRNRAIGASNVNGYHSFVVGRDGMWARGVDAGESEAVEIELGDAHSHRRVLSSPNDDIPYGFSPDGRFLAFGSSRWNGFGHKNIGLFDLRANQIVRRITADENVDDAHILWLPDGSRIVFMRKYFNRVGTAACIVGFDGRGERCLTPEDMRVLSILGLLNGTSVLVRATWRGVTANYMVGTDSTFVERASALPTAIASIDPSGRWALYGASAVAGRPYPQVVPYGQWDRGRRIELPAGVTNPNMIWMPNPNPRFLDRLVRRDSVRELPVGVPFQIAMAGIASDSAPVALPPLQWKSLRPDVATVDSTGTVVPHRAGVAVIESSAHGWRSRTDTFAVVPTAQRVMFTEAWAPDWRDRWRAFGEPLPAVRSVANRAVFANNGDGNYESGAYLKRRLPSKRGLAVEFEVSTPVTATQWQTVVLALNPGMDTKALERWDHITAGLPSPIQISCEFRYPTEEGVGGVSQMSPGGPIARLPVATQRKMPNGRWYRVTLQLLPDGRCGVAVEGIPVELRQQWGALPDSLTVLVSGNSRGTSMLIGEVRITDGVIPGIDWTPLAYDGVAWRRPVGPAVSRVAELIRPTKPMSFVGAGK